MDNNQVKKELSNLVMESIVIGFKNGHITDQEFMTYMKEAQDMMNDTPEEIRQLGNMMIDERWRRERDKK